MKSQLGIACLTLVLLAQGSCAEENKGWSWGSDNKKAEDKVGPSAEDYEAAESAYPQQLGVVNATAVEDVVDTILVSNRQGRNIEGLDEIYKDPNVRQALDSGDDTQARNIIRDRLCNLGLMQCDGESLDPKRPYVAPEDLIYAQPVDIKPVGHPVPSIPVRGPPRAYGPPKPISLSNGPPRKVGYGGPPIRPGYGPPSKYGGPPIPGPFGPGGFSSGSLNSFSSSGSTYLSKPPGPIYDGGIIEGEIPYEFERPIKSGYIKDVKVGSASSLSGEVAAVQQHIHHHYHHGDDKNKPSAILVNNPIPIGTESHQHTSVSGGFQSGSGFSGVNGGGFSGVNSGGFSGVNSGGFSGVNSGGFNPVNSGFGSSGGLYSSGGVKPVYENSGPGYSGVYKGSSQNQAGVYNLGYASGASYAPSSSGSSSIGSYTNTNQFYKKELNTSPLNNNALGSGSAYSTNQYSSQYGYTGQESGRAERYDCVCVPYDQCPSQDIIGRKDDLFLPIDPRNLPKDIEALPDDKVVITDGNGTMTVVRVPKNVDFNNATNTDKAEVTKKISKRETNDKASDSANKSNIAPRQSGSDDDESRGLFGKKIQPTFGVSFGLPHSGYGGYPLNPYGPNPIVNPYGSSIGGGGLNLGLINVDPLVSVQVTKNDYGEKVIKPLVNLHVTPNDHLVHKVGSYLNYKKQLLFNKPFLGGFGHGGHGGYGGGGGYHPSGPGYIHNHYHYGPIRPSGPSHYGPPPHFERPHPPPPFYGGGGGGFRPAYPGVYREAEYDEEGPSYDDDITPFTNPGGFYGRSISDPNGQAQNQNQNYAQNYNSYNRVQNDQAQNPIQADNGRNVKFPTSRRRRETSESNDKEARNIAKKRQAFYQPQLQQIQQQQQQCGPRQVCCKRPYRPQNQISNRGQCGVRHSQGINGRIKNPVYVDGDSEFGEYPWQVAILKKDPKESVYVCGGTLIDHLHIVTAAHCVKTYTGFDLRVRLGEWDVNHDVEFFPYIERDVVSVHVHPQYYAGTLDNDLAILKLDQPVEWTKYPHISPACLPDKFTDYTGARCWTTGWGKDAFGDFGKYQNILKEVDVPVISHHQCEAQLKQTRLGYQYQLNPGFICAGGEEGKDACKGDGGGPMVCERGGSWQLVGVVSWGIGCGQVNVPGVYVKVAHYLDWITQVTGRY